MSRAIKTIVLPTRPQPDTIVAIFLLQQFGKEAWPGVESATVAVEPAAAPDDTKLLLDVGGGELDHHGTDKCASELVAEKLGVANNPELRTMLAYAKRDDTKGKGTLSKDPIDRAFGLSGLIASLNKQFPTNPQAVVAASLPLLEAQYHNSYEHYIALPTAVQKLKEAKQFETVTITGEQPNMKVAFVESDHNGLPSYLRSNTGGNYKIIVQRRSTGHTNIITKQNPKIDLSKLMAVLRLYEANLQGITISNQETLFETGTHPQVPNWYYDPATNSLLNGGISPEQVSATAIPWPELKAIVTTILSETK